MNASELLDRLCAVVEMQASIIREQGLFINQMSAVDEEDKRKFAEKRDAVDAELESIGNAAVPLRLGFLQKGENIDRT